MLKVLAPVILLASFSAWSLEIPAQDFTREQAVRHLLSRASYGPRPQELVELVKPGALEKWLERQLHPESIDDHLAATEIRKIPVPQMLGKELFVQFPISEISEKSNLHTLEIMQEMSFQRLYLANASEKELSEVMVDFWFNHFSVSAIFPQYVPLYERDTIRPHIFGKFSEMIVAVAKSPLMLYYLNNWESAKSGATTSDEMKRFLGWPYTPGGINENYGRELLELHTIGYGSGYTQKDVENAALVFTGWTIANHQSDPKFAYVDSWHDESDVSVFGKKLSGKDGLREGVALLNYLSERPETAHFISEKLCRRFEQDPPTEACINRLSKKYLSSHGNLREIYQALFTSPEFWNFKTYQTRTKKPFDFLASSLRAMDSKLAVSTDKVAELFKIQMRSGQDLYLCPVPSGYSDEDAVWRNSRMIISRGITSRMLANLGEPQASLQSVNWVKYISSPEFQKR